ncbi:hypothetical protein MICRO8M_80547 [Microbacterium sp. 8M]|nr:hypothetical protein MICRO8M_80547 [Microbacterium sp. 8M]
MARGEREHGDDHRRLHLRRRRHPLRGRQREHHAAGLRGDGHQGGGGLPGDGAAVDEPRPSCERRRHHADQQHPQAAAVHRPGTLIGADRGHSAPRAGSGSVFGRPEPRAWGGVVFSRGGAAARAPGAGRRDRRSSVLP